MSRIRIIILLLCFAAACIEVGYASAQASGGWSQPLDLDPDSNVSWFPDLAVGPDGSVHVIWATGVKDPRNKVYGVQDLLGYRFLQNGKWSAPNTIANPGGTTAATRNSIALGRDGQLNVLLRSEFRIDFMHAAWDRAWSARWWSKPRTLNELGSPYYNALAVDSKGSIHALWTQGVADDPGKPRPECTQCSDLFYRRSSDGGSLWSRPIDLFPSPDGASRPQIKIDSRDRIHVVWSEGFDFIAGKGVSKSGVYLRSDDGGATWGVPHVFSLSNDAIQQIALAITSDDRPFVVYRGVSDDRMYYQTQQGQGESWSNPAEIPGIRARWIHDNNLDAYSLITDSANHIHLLATAFITTNGAVEQQNPWLLHLVWDGQRWSAPNVVMGGNLYPEWPRLAIFGGNQLHAVWFTRRKEDLFSSEQGAHYQIWYSTVRVDAPYVAPLPIITAVPTPIPTMSPVPSPSPTPTPLPPALRQVSVLDSKPSWETNGILAVAKALLPVVAFLGLCWLVVGKRRTG